MKKLFFITAIIFALTLGITYYASAYIETPDAVEPPISDVIPGETCESEGGGNEVCNAAGQDCEDNDPIGYSCIDRGGEEEEEEPSPTAVDEEDDDTTATPTPIPGTKTNNLCSGADKQTCA